MTENNHTCHHQTIMKYIKSLAILIIALITTSCTTYKDEPGGGGGNYFQPFYYVDSTITATVENVPSLGKVWNVSEMTVYRKWYFKSATADPTLVSDEITTVKYSGTNRCYSEIPSQYSSLQVGDKVTDLPIQLILETGHLGSSTDLTTLCTVLKLLDKSDLPEKKTEEEE